jgi:hypothetical protein
MATEFKIPLHRFDTNLLPPEARQVGTEAFKTAVMMHFAPSTRRRARRRWSRWTTRRSP